MAERILIVEDEAKLARFVELELTHEGYSFGGWSGILLRNFFQIVLDFCFYSKGFCKLCFAYTGRTEEQK